jgi:hypothetical protein
MCIPLSIIESTDLIIYQPLSDVHNCYSTNKNNPDSFFNLLSEKCNTISFPRIHNNAIFPIFKKRFNGNELYGKINNKINDINHLEYLYDNDMLDYDFCNRLQQNYLINTDKEKNTEIKIIDYIYNNLHKHKIFLTQDHPTTFIFNKIASNICDLLDLDYNFEKTLNIDDNWANLPDSTHGIATNQYPISKYSIKYFNFEYIKEETNDAYNFYKNNTINYYNNYMIN